MASHQVRGRGVTGNPVSCTFCLFKKQLHNTNSDPPLTELMGLQEQFPFRPGPSLAQFPGPVRLSGKSQVGTVSWMYDLGRGPYPSVPRFPDLKNGHNRLVLSIK